IFTPAQVKGWRQVTNAVHARGGRIFFQLAHSGSSSHPEFLEGETPRAPSAINLGTQTYTTKGLTPVVTPIPFTLEEISETIADYRKAAENAKEAGFDGIEIHAQIYTLIPQFLSTATNQRTDQYGGSIENRARFLFEVLDAVSE